MTRLVLGVIGHVDHGKTTLVRALTGIETDRLAEEKLRGVSIVLGFAHADIGGMIDFVDAPGHERFVRAMVGGVTGADAVLVVVDAHEGLMPQTREHLAIAALLGVREAIVAVTKADLASAARAHDVASQTAAAAAKLGLAPSPPVAVCAPTAQGLDGLRAAIADLAARRDPPRDDGFAYLPIDRAFIVPGQGVVVTGTLRRGRLTPQTALEVLPCGLPARVRGLQAHGLPIAVAEPGQRVAVNLRGAELHDLPRGAVLATAGVLAPSRWLTVRLRHAPDAPPLANGASVDLLIGASHVPARVRLLDCNGLEAGETALAQLCAAEPLAVPADDGFVLRAGSPAVTMAGGSVIDPAAPRLPRFDSSRLESLAALAKAAPTERMELLLANAGARGVALARIAALAGLAPDRAVKASGAVRLKGDVLVAPADLERTRARVVQVLEASTEPLSRAALAQAVGRVGPEVLEAAISALAGAGRVRAASGRVALVRAAEDQARAGAQAGLARRMAEALRQGGLAPSDLALDTREARAALQDLVRAGIAVRAPDRVQKREVVFHREAIEAARRRLADLLAGPPGLTVGEIGRALGISRKFSVPLLEHLDAVGFTRRNADRRLLTRPDSKGGTEI
jgi:selenocysteine-specific elongation factor